MGGSEKEEGSMNAERCGTNGSCSGAVVYSDSVF